MSNKKSVYIQARRKRKDAQVVPVATVQWHYEPKPSLAQRQAWKEFWGRMYTSFLQAQHPRETAA